MAAGSKRGRKAPPRARRKPLAPRKPAARASTRDATLKQQLAEARAQQAATAAILKVISRSPANVQPVLDAIARSAAKLCEAQHAVFYRLHADGYRPEAAHNVGKEYLAYRKLHPIPVSSKQVMGRIALTRKPVHVLDVLADPDYRGAAAQKLAEYRTVLGVPVIREGKLLGNLAVFRTEVRAFSKQQVALLQTFADQAAIAIENVRLFNETKEALERQTATAEILKVIAGSPADVQPVFSAILRSAVNLCGAEIAAVFPYDGELVHLGATHNWSEEALRYFSTVYPAPPSPTLLSGRTILSKSIVKIADAAADGHYDPDSAATGHWRRMLGVPMMRESEPLGALVVSWREPGETLQRQVDLLQTFADQAVIAIENVRLFNETKEALERQTATADILKVIASSPADIQPVFDAIVETAKRLIGAFSATVTQVGNGKLHLVAHTATTPEGAEALNRYFPIPVEGTPMGRATLLRRPEFIDDFEADTDDARNGRELARSRGFRSVVFVPLIRGGVAIGSLNVTRRESGRMAGHQIDLLKTFADQAVIAIENVRLFNETKEALERQTATAEILRVIASSPSDVRPVFDAIAASARRLLNGHAALVARRAGDRLELEAFTPTSAAADEALRALFPSPITGKGHMGQAILSAAPVLVSDIENDERYSGAFRASARVRGVRSVVSVPMLREAEPIGVISVNRAVAGNFSEHQTNLLRTFADQAVIAIENVRLFNETKEALERQTATSEVLRVIGSSVTDIQPVFDIIAERAARLTGAEYGWVFRFDGEQIHVASAVGVNAEGREAARRAFPMRPSGGSITARAIRDGKVVNVADVLAEDDTEYKTKEIAKLAGYRATLSVPMIRDRQIVGAITASRAAVGKFSDKEVDLLGTFADQAVIAIENVRLFNETKEALERQTATAEILKVIASSPSDVQPVFDAIAQSALRLIGGVGATVTRIVGDELQLAALTSTTESGNDAVRSVFPQPISTGVGMNARTIRERKSLFIGDIETDPLSTAYYREMGRARGFRAVVGTPMMMRDGEPIGAISVTRGEPGPFSEHEVKLLQTFADQAVIAIENVRLFNETKEALERQTATAEILKVIASSPSDVQPVFDAIAVSAMRLLGGLSGSVTQVIGDMVHMSANTSTNQAAVDRLKSYYPRPLSSTKATRRVLRSGKPEYRSDYESDPDTSPDTKELARELGFRSNLWVPLVRDGVAFGTINVARAEAGPFSDHQIKLLETFASQAVIAIENVRLFNETKEALERQTATAEILRVISSSPTDAQPVFEAIVQSGLKLFSGAGVGISIVEGAELRVVAAAGNLSAVARGILLPISRESASGMAIVEKRVVNIRDTEAPDAPPHARDNGRKLNVRSMTQAPMFREGEPVGVIGVTLKDPGGLDDKQLALLETFADQAVIAIENVRLFKELEARTEALTKSVGQLTALGEVGQAISSTLDLETVLQTIVSRAVQLTGMDAGSIYEYDEQEEVYRLQAADKMEPELVEAVRKTPIRKGDGATGRTAVTLEPVQVADIEDKSYQGTRKDNLRRTGYRAVLAVPLLREDILLGALQVFRKSPGPFAPEVVELLKTFATQSAMAIQNARLFREIAEKGKQLEVASRHKSDFLASMSHELRTPLNAILGFNEMILGQIYGEVPKDMQEPLEDIQKSGKHLLRLINNVLDLAKIEAGRMELALSDYSVHDTVESVRATLRPLAAEKGLEFAVSVPQDLPLAYGDSGRIMQCLMNLAGNSLKFTKAGRVEIAVTENDGLLTYRVTDTGVGIPPDKIGSLFTEFKQTDATIASEYGGTGLGLSISKKFVEMHGGRIWIESELGKGSSFIFEIPLRVKTP